MNKARKNDRRYYVYVYIDPRNYEEFYYGKGCGSRRKAHLDQEGDLAKHARIQAIRKEGLEPIIKTVAAGLTESEAHLIETTLIWKLGRSLTNAAAGRYVSLFRPQNTLHKHLPSFDFQNRIYHFNVGDGPHRTWEDCRKYGFLSAGQDPYYSDQIRDIGPGDVVVAYLKEHGFVGVGNVLDRAVPYVDFRVGERPLHKLKLEAPKMNANANNASCEYVIRVKWRKSFPWEQAKWERNAGLYRTQRIASSFANQQKTMKYIEREFGIRFEDLAS